MLVDDRRPPPRYSDESFGHRSMSSRDFNDRALSGGGPMRLMGAGAASPEQMHQQNRLEMVQQYDPRVFILKIVVVSLVLIGTVTMIVYTEVQGAQCDEQLSLWLVVYAFLLVAMITTIATNFYNYRRRRRVNQAHSILNFSLMLWWILGQVWVYRTGTCDISIRATVLALIILEYLRLCFPCILIMLICCCMPCIAPFLDTVSMKGAEKKEIKKLPTKKYEPMADNPDDQCSVCLENFEAGEEVRTLPCGHYFHDHCIDEWLVLNRTCPLCRKDIGDKDGNGARKDGQAARDRKSVV